MFQNNIDYFVKSLREADNLSTKRSHYKSENNFHTFNHNILDPLKEFDNNGLKEKEEERSSKISKHTSIKKRHSILLQNKLMSFGNKSIKESGSGILSNLQPSNASLHFPNSNSNINNVESNGNIENPRNHTNKDNNFNSNFNLSTNYTTFCNTNKNGFSGKTNPFNLQHHSPQPHSISHQNLNSLNYNYKENIIGNHDLKNDDLKKKTTSNIDNNMLNSPIKEIINNESFENEIGNNFELDLAYKKCDENFMESSNTKIAKVACCPNVNLKYKYTEIGVMRMNFYDILQEKEDFIRKRTSRVFRSFSHHYTNNEINNIKLNTFVNNNNNNEMSSPKKNLLNSPNDRIKRNSYNLSNNNSNLNSSSSIQNNSPSKNINNEGNLPMINNNDDEYAGITRQVIKFNIFDSINSSFSQDVLHNGSEIGKIDGFIFIDKIPSLKQIMCGVHTERGLDITANYLTIPNMNQLESNNNDIKSPTQTAINGNNINALNLKDNLPNELKQINLNCESLLLKLIQKSSFNFKEISLRELNLEIVTILGELAKLLSISVKQNCLFFNYKNPEEIAHAQQIILELGCNIIHVLDDMVNEQRQHGYKIIDLIIDRAELDLANMSLTQYSQWSKSMQEIKNKVSESFINFMLQALNYTLEKLGRKVTDNKLKNFIENFLAYSYFKIPKVK